MTEVHDTSEGSATATRRNGLNATIARLFFGLGCGMSVVGAAAYGLLDLRLEPGMQAMLVSVCSALALVFALATVLLRRAPLSTVMLVVGWSGVTVVALTAVGVGEGVRSLSLGFFGLMVCLVTVLTSLRAGLVLALGCVAAVLGLTWAESARLLPGVLALQRNPTVLHVIAHMMLLATAVVAGTQMSQMIDRAMRDAEERQQRFRNLLAIAADWYWELDADLRFKRIDTHVHASAGPAAEARIGQRPWESPQLDMDPIALDLHRQDLEAHRPFSDLPVRYRSPSGRLSHFSVSGRPRFDEDGHFRGYWGVGRDITPEVQAREAHRASETRYRELFAMSPTPLVLHRNGITMLANEAAARLFGFASPEAMGGFNLEQLYPVPQRGLLHDRIRTLNGYPIGKTLDLAEFHLHAVDGRRLTVQANSARVSTNDGTAILSMYFDVTERVSTEIQLRRSQAMLSHLFATSPDFITLSDMETGVYVMVNESFTRMFGYSAAEVVGKSALELGIWYQPADRQRMVAELLAHGGVNEVETLFVHKSGAIVTLMMSAGRFTMDGRNYLVVNGRDVTEIQRTRLEHEAILKNASIGIALTRNQRFLQANPSFERMFGWASGELIGKPGAVVWATEEDYAEVGRIAGPLLSVGKPVEIERQMLRHDGTLFWCRLLAQVVDPGHPSMGGTIWIAEDVTERRQIEQALAAARDVAEAASRAKSAFLANTSHEIRTPLNGLLGLASLAMQKGVDEKRRLQYLEQIQDSAQSLSGIISDILDLSKIEAGKFSIEAVPFNLRHLLKAVHHAYQSLATARSLQLKLDVAPDVPVTVLGDPVRLRQILSNYITNGLKFTERGEVSLEVSMSTAPARSGQVRFTVSDTGPGIDTTTQKRLFQPFTQADDSTTRRFGGTGLGLSICKELAELMDGAVGVDSTPGIGSRFWAELPLPPTDLPVVDPRVEAEDIQRLEGLRVLLVEDNPVNMMIGVAMLEQWGVEVTQAADGAEGVAAVERAQAAQRPFHVVLMDVQMPRLSGHEAARQLRCLYSAEELPIIALTAAALVSEREEALASGMNDFLTKPIDVHKLRVALVRAVG
ncbi:PAS domain S-box protein [Piscinibacter gummiphilus]|uniref:histidine kinase n=1 Tax=Piscinibacter gummiphilus TaxID=946333 RepID=A0ABZ0CUU7_9BURK|nr:PAS domain S-box protein [Piscinibacter gummiphilus]WOB08648.1 PAS domain S-box protein [Piscinibacter gummiphilus]